MKKSVHMGHFLLETSMAFSNLALFFLHHSVLGTGG